MKENNKSNQVWQQFNFNLFMNYPMKADNDMWSWYRFTMREELGKLTF